MQVARPVGHADTVARLWRAARDGRLPHALLFEGRPGIGKFQAARWLAAGQLCRQGPGEPCGTCGPCRQVASGGERGNHPDLFIIDPLLEKEERIRISRIAERSARGADDSPELCLEVFLSLRPLAGSSRVVLIRESQRMNVQAQNALLKTLEEPRPGTLLVLETHRPGALLQTIKSRCIRIRFEPLGHEESVQVLCAQGLEEQAARELARLAEGSPGRALEMAKDGTRAALGLLGEAALGRVAPLEIANALRDVDGAFPGKTLGVRERGRARMVLGLAVALVRDAWRVHAGVPPQSLPLGELAGPLAAHRGAHALVARGELLAELYADVNRNFQPQHLIERALLALTDGVVPSLARS